MTDVMLLRFKIKKGQLKKCLSWMRRLKSRASLESLKAHGIISQAYFLSEDRRHVLCFIEAKDLTTTRKAIERGSFQIEPAAGLDWTGNLHELFHLEHR